MKTIAFALAALGLSACAQLTGRATLPLHTTLPVEVRPSPSFEERRPSFVVLHHTTNDDAEGALETLTNPAAKVSAHYLIGRDGRIVYLVDERARAWHAGISYWGGNRDINSASIGIELDNNGREPFSEPQIQTLLALLADLKARWNIPAANFLGHGDVAPGRKVDPSRWFPWRRLAANGYGLWCDPPFESAAADDATLLAALGYDVSRPLPAAAAFKRRYSPDDTSPALTDAQRGMLQCLIRKQQLVDDPDVPRRGGG
jgi:N-acetylmuramoyl-L-alanine amidase